MLNNKKYSLDRLFPGIYSTFFFCLSICFFLFLSLAGLDPHEQILIINNKYRLFRFLSSSVCCPPTPPLPPPVEKGQSCQRSLEQTFFSPFLPPSQQKPTIHTWTVWHCQSAVFGMIKAYVFIRIASWQIKSQFYFPKSFQLDDK